MRLAGSTACACLMYSRMLGMPRDAIRASSRMKYLTSVSRSLSELLTGVAVSRTTRFGLPAVMTRSTAPERCAPELRRLWASSMTTSE